MLSDNRIQIRYYFRFRFIEHFLEIMHQFYMQAYFGITSCRVRVCEGGTEKTQIRLFLQQFGFEYN